MGVSFWQVLILVVVVLLVFGPKRIPGLGKALGEAIRGFRSGVKGSGKTGGDESENGEEEKIAEKIAADKPETPDK